MKNLKYIALIVLLFGVTTAMAATILFPSGGGTGRGTLTSGQLIYGNGVGPVGSVATTTASCSGSASCSAFTIIGSSPITITASGGSSLGYPFPLAGNATSTLTQFNGGLTAYGTSTIGDGSTVGGLTISGNSTTTGSSYVGSNLGIGIQGPGQALDILGKLRATNTLADSTNKAFYFLDRNYLNSQNDFLLMFGQSKNTANTLIIGGGQTGFTAASTISFFTGAGNNTDTGTSKLSIDSNGIVSFAYSSSTIYSSFITASTTNLITGNLNFSTTSVGCASIGSNGNLFSTGSPCGSSSGLTAYDAWLHPYSASSATTSTLYLQGLSTNASSTLGSTVFFPSLTQGFAGIGTNGQIYTFATSSIKGSQINNDSGWTSNTGTLTSITVGAGHQNQGAVFTTTGTLVGAIATSATPSIGGLAFWNNAGDATNPAKLGTVGTTSLAIDTSLSNSGALGSQIGGSASTLSLNLGHTNTWSILQNFNYSSSTIYSSFFNASTTFLNAGSITVATSSAGCAAFMSSGLLTSTGVACGSGGGLLSYDPFSHPFSPFYSATSSVLSIGTSTPNYSQLTIGTSTVPQLTLTDNNNTNAWTFRDAGNFLYISTSSPSTFATSSKSALTVDNNGFLSIGANAGTGCAQFDINGKITNIGSPCGSSSGLSSYDAWSHPAAGQSATTSLILLFGNASTTALSVGATATTTITADGSIGSGTTTPYAQVSIQRNNNIPATTPDFVIASSSLNYLTFNTQGAGDILDIGTTTSASQYSFSIGSTGLVGVGQNGTSTPWGQLSIQSVSGLPQFVIGSSTATSFIVDKNGNVGIGTTTPGSLLSIGGTGTGINFYDNATSTFTKGVNIANGCYSIAGTCIGGSSGGSTFPFTSQYWGNSTTSTIGFITGGFFATASSSVVTSKGAITFGDIPGSSNSDAGISFRPVSAVATSSLFTELNGGILSLGINVGQIGNVNTARSGGIFRFDTRTGGADINGNSHNFVVIAQPSGGTASYNPFIIDLNTNDIGLNTDRGVTAIGTSTVLGLARLLISSSTAPQISLSSGANFSQWTFRNSGGNLYIATSSIDGTATTTTTALTILNNGNVGIGTSTPTTQFSVDSASSSPTTAQATPFGFLQAMTINAVRYIVMFFDYYGHIFYSGPVPTIGSCGTGSPSIVGNDNVMIITTGTGSVTECTVNFAHTWGANAPVCTVDDQGSTLVTVDASTTATTLKIGLSATLTSSTIGATCTGYK